MLPLPVLMNSIGCYRSEAWAVVVGLFDSFTASDSIQYGNKKEILPVALDTLKGNR